MDETTTTQKSDLEKKIEAKQEELKKLINPEEGEDAPTADAVKTATEELKALHAKRKVEAESMRAKELLAWLDEIDDDDKPAVDPETTKTQKEKDENAGKAAGEIFTESEGFKNYSYGGVMPDVKIERSLEEVRFGPMTKAARMEAAVKALFQTTAGFAPESVRGPEIVGIIHRPVQLLDRLRQVPTTQESIKWMEQTTRTVPPSSGNTAEGAIYREVALEYTERSADIIKKTAWLPVTEEQLADVPGIQDMVTSQLPAILGEIIDEDTIKGAGTNGTMIGVESLSNRQTRTREADESVYAAIVRGIGDVQVNGRATPDLILMHTLDWYEMILEQGRDGNYIFGMLAQQGQSPWGLPVVQCDFLTRGEYIVGDFARYHMLRDRQDMRTRIAPRYNSAGSQTAPTGQVMIFSDVRAQNQFLRPQAFVHIS